MATITSASGFAFYSLVKHFELIQPDRGWETPAAYAEAELQPRAASVVPALPTAYDNEEVLYEPPKSEFLLVDVAANVSASDGAIAGLKVVGRAEECGASYVPPKRRQQGWSSTSQGGVTLVSHWCLPAKADSEIGYRSFTGIWTADSGPVDADYAVNYLRYTTSQGTPAAVKVTALAVCDEDKGCGYVASAVVDEDNNRFDEAIPLGNGAYQHAWLIADDDSYHPVEIDRSGRIEPSEYHLTVPAGQLQLR